MAIHVDVIVQQVDGENLVAGSLRTHIRRGESATFSYIDSYLRDPRAYGLDPTLPLVAGPIQTPPGRTIFNAFSDAAPDRWGRSLLTRAERRRAQAVGEIPRTMTEGDYLLGVRDEFRQGAVRFRDPDTGVFQSADDSSVPALVSLPRLLKAADHFSQSGPDDPAIADLIAAGGSQGGARPKAAVVATSGKLAIAKFPKNPHGPQPDEWDVVAWEHTALELARKAGISVPPSTMIKVANRNVLIVERFDRRENHRIGFCSALTLLELDDLQRSSYLEMAGILEETGSHPADDLPQLWRRMVFSQLINDTDNHPRNHGFLRSGSGWALSPIYDVNPNPDTNRERATVVDLGQGADDIDSAVEVAELFRLDPVNARRVLGEVLRAIGEWKAVARSSGITAFEIKLMGSAFESINRDQALTKLSQAPGVK